VEGDGAQDGGVVAGSNGPSMSSAYVRRICLAVLLASSSGACYSTGEGPSPPPNALYFPVGILPSPGGKALYIVNSDFDLQFNGGTVEVYNLEDIRDVALRPFWSPSDTDDRSDPCFGLGPNPNVILYPGPCGPLDLNRPPARPVPYGPIFQRSARIGAFATDLVMACHPSEEFRLGGTADCMRGGAANGRGARLFIPVRGDRSLTFFDVDDDREGGEQSFKLDCGQGTSHGRCSDAFRSGIDPAENTRGITLPAEPFGIAVSDRGDAIVVTHQSSSSGSVSLFSGNKDPDTSTNSVLAGKPRLEFVLSGLPGSATGIAAFPTPGIDAYDGFDRANYQPGFAVTYRLVAQVDVFRFFDDDFASPQRPFLQRTAAFGLPPTPSGSDSRDITIDTSRTTERAVCERECRRAPLERCIAECADLTDTNHRSACETGCQSDPERECLKRCTRYPIGVYSSNRFLGGGALLIGEVRLPNTSGSTEALQFYDSVPVSLGASRVVLGRIHDRRDPPGVFRPRVFVVCFDARAIIVYDPAERRVDGLIRTGRGPHALVMDPIAPIAYVGHFTDSYLGLVDLDQSHGTTFATIVATIGTPVSPQGSK
jgi:hypothetical protein